MEDKIVIIKQSQLKDLLSKTFDWGFTNGVDDAIDELRQLNEAGPAEHSTAYSKHSEVVEILEQIGVEAEDVLYTR